jgi:hypothetical protein
VSEGTGKPHEKAAKKAAQREQGRSPLISARRERRLAALAEAERRLPISFSIVGVQKAATSSLYRMLVKHPAVAGGPEKEMRFFIDEDRDWSDPDYSDYARPANDPSLTLAGDATPAYFFWPHALERMRRYDPDLRLMVTLRDPIERAFSQWSMERYWKPSFPDLPDAIELFAGDALPDDVPDDKRPHRLRKESLFTRGLYGEQLRRGLAHFPREQWLVLDFRGVFSRQGETLDAATEFLGIDRFEEYPPILHRNQTPTDHTGAAPTVEHVSMLVELYRHDLAELAELSGLDVSQWSTSRVIAGELSVEELTAKLVQKLGLQRP